MAEIIRTEIRNRSVFATLIRWLFLAFNLIMAGVVLYTCSFNTHHIASSPPQEEVDRAVASIIVMGINLLIWAFGALALGFIVWITRGEKVTVERTLGR